MIINILLKLFFFFFCADFVKKSMEWLFKLLNTRLIWKFASMEDFLNLVFSIMINFILDMLEYRGQLDNRALVENSFLHIPPKL